MGNDEELKRTLLPLSFGLDVGMSAYRRQYEEMHRRYMEWYKLRSEKLSNYYGKQAGHRTDERRYLSDDVIADFERTVFLHIENTSDKKQMVYLFGTPAGEKNTESIKIENCDTSTTYEDVLNEISLGTYGYIKNIDLVVYKDGGDWDMSMDVYSDNKKVKIDSDVTIDPFRRPHNTVYISRSSNFEFKTQKGDFCALEMPPKSYWEFTYSRYPNSTIETY